MAEGAITIARGILGVCILLSVCWVFSVDRKAVNWRLVVSGLALQSVLVFLMLKVPVVEKSVESIALFFKLVIDFAAVGSEFLFGELVTNETYHAQLGFRVLPSIIFFAAIISILYYLGILQRIVYAFAWLMQRTMKLSGAETLSAAANVFIGYTEAPLVVRPYIERMTRSEILCLMTVGMATMSGTILGIYMSVIGGGDEVKTVAAGKHLITASLMTAPIALVVSKILYPETEKVDQNLKVSRESIGVNIFDAVATGTHQGLRLAVTVLALLIVFISLIHLCNYITRDWIGEWLQVNQWIASATEGKFEGLTLQFMAAVIFAPVAWVIGIDAEHALLVGQLLGERIVLTEFIAYLSLGDMISTGILTDPKAIVISTFALCGFAHLSSCSIIIGGLSTLAPGQRHNFASLVLRALAGGTISTLINDSVAGAILG